MAVASLIDLNIKLRCLNLSHTVINDTFLRAALDKGCTDIMYLTIEYPNYSLISLGGSCVDLMRLRNSNQNNVNLSQNVLLRMDYFTYLVYFH